MRSSTSQQDWHELRLQWWVTDIWALVQSEHSRQLGSVSSTGDGGGGMDMVCCAHREATQVKGLDAVLPLPPPCTTHARISASQSSVGPKEKVLVCWYPGSSRVSVSTCHQWFCWVHQDSGSPLTKLLSHRWAKTLFPSPSEFLGVLSSYRGSETSIVKDILTGGT